MKLAHGVLSVRQLEMSMQTIIKCPPYATFLGTRYLVVRLVHLIQHHVTYVWGHLK
jgi:hypothetical protein